MKNIVLLLILVFSSLFLSPIWANSIETPKINSVHATVSEFTQLHQLTKEQSTEMLEVIKASEKKRDRLLKKFRIALDSGRKVRLNLRKKQELLTNMKKIKDNQEYKLSQILSENQMSSWLSFIKKNQELFKQRLLDIIG